MVHLRRELQLQRRSARRGHVRPTSPIRPDGDVAGGIIEDQIDPFIAAHPVSGKGAVAWYDTAENASGNIASVHGQVQSLSSTSLVGQRILLPSVPLRLPERLRTL